MATRIWARRQRRRRIIVTLFGDVYAAAWDANRVINRFCRATQAGREILWARTGRIHSRPVRQCNRRLALFNDRFGQRPLYYYRRAGQLRFPTAAARRYLLRALPAAQSRGYGPVLCFRALPWAATRYMKTFPCYRLAACWSSKRAAAKCKCDRSCPTRSVRLTHHRRRLAGSNLRSYSHRRSSGFRQHRTPGLGVIWWLRCTDHPRLDRPRTSRNEDDLLGHAW